MFFFKKWLKERNGFWVGQFVYAQFRRLVNYWMIS